MKQVAGVACRLPWATIVLFWGASAGGCAEPTALERFTRERPPCRLPALSDAQVVEAARKTLGESFAPTGLPDPPYLVTQNNCIYYFEWSLDYIDGHWKPVGSMPEGDGLILVSRDSGTFLFQVVLPSAQQGGEANH